MHTKLGLRSACPYPFRLHGAKIYDYATSVIHVHNIISNQHNSKRTSDHKTEPTSARLSCTEPTYKAFYQIFSLA